MSDTIKKTCEKCEIEFDGIYDEENLCDECLEIDDWRKIGIIMKLDGDKWCATRLNFINLVESPAGFGKTKEESYKDLISK